jgi:hypothetical protein
VAAFKDEITEQAQNVPTNTINLFCIILASRVER